jgi:hypothetical protein
VEWHSWIEPLNQATAMTDEALAFIAPGNRDDDQLDPLVPGHVLEAEAAGGHLVAHSGVQP